MPEFIRAFELLRVGVHEIGENLPGDDVETLRPGERRVMAGLRTSRHCGLILENFARTAQALRTKIKLKV